jgi:hypothetical protein
MNEEIGQITDLATLEAILRQAETAPPIHPHASLPSGHDQLYS